MPFCRMSGSSSLVLSRDAESQPCTVSCVGGSVRSDGSWSCSTAQGRKIGVVECTFTQTVAGNYEIYANIDGSKLSPSLLCEVRPGPSSVENSTVTGTGTSFAVVGVQSAFTIASVDAFGNPRRRGGDTWVAWLVLPSSHRQTGNGKAAAAGKVGRVRLTIRDEDDGTYKCVYTVPRAGVFELHIGMRERTCAGSSPPSRKEHKDGRGSAAGTCKWSNGDNRPTLAWVKPIAGSPFELVVAEGGSPALARLAHRQQEAQTTQDAQDGKHPPQQDVSRPLSVRSIAATSTAPSVRIKAAPYTVCGEEWQLDIALSDGWGQPDASRLAVSIKHCKTDESALPTIRSTSTGFEVSFTPRVSGAYQAYLRLDGRAINATPLRIAAIPAQADSSAFHISAPSAVTPRSRRGGCATSSSLRVDSSERHLYCCGAGDEVNILLMPRDRFGNAVLPFAATGGRGSAAATVSLAFTHADGGNVETGTAKVHHGATYALQWRLSRTGRYGAVVSIGEPMARGSTIARFTVRVVSARPSKLLLAPGTRLAGETFESGKRVSIQFALFDAFGNLCNDTDKVAKPDDDVTVQTPFPYVACTACLAEDPPRLRSLGDGRFEVLMRLILLGEHWLRSAPLHTDASFSEVSFFVCAGPACPSQSSIRAPKFAETHKEDALHVDFRDRMGNQATAPVPLNVRIMPRNHGLHGRVVPPEYSDGSSRIAFVLDASGEYEVSVMIGQAHVQGSPFMIHASPRSSERLANASNRIQAPNGSVLTSSSTK